MDFFIDIKIILTSFGAGTKTIVQVVYVSMVFNIIMLQIIIMHRILMNWLQLNTSQRLEEFSIPNELRLTNGGAANNWITIFSSNDDLYRLSNSEHWHSDGTCKLHSIWIFKSRSHFILMLCVDCAITFWTTLCFMRLYIWSYTSIDSLYGFRKIWNLI